MRLMISLRVYLKQELPAPYNELIEIKDEKFVIKIPKNDLEFNVNFDNIYNMVIQRVKDIRGRDSNLNFTVKRINQLRDFTINKDNFNKYS